MAEEIRNDVQFTDEQIGYVYENRRYVGTKAIAEMEEKLRASKLGR